MFPVSTLSVTQSSATACLNDWDPAMQALQRPASADPDVRERQNLADGGEISVDRFSHGLNLMRMALAEP
jgi:hypothetical protein